MADKFVNCILAAVTALGIGALWASRAEAQEAPTPTPSPEMRCGPTQEVFDALHEGGFVEVAVMPLSGQVVFMILSTPGGAHWVQVSIRADRTTCIIVEGADLATARVPAIGERSA